MVRTSVIESSLREMANQLGVRILTGISVTNLSETLQELGINPGVIVGLDGSHSQVRRDVFGGLMGVHDSLQFFVDVKYEVYGSGKKMHFLSQVYCCRDVVSWDETPFPD